MIGRHKLGQTAHFYVQCKNGRTPTIPDDVPIYRIYSGSALVKTGKMPVIDRRYVTAFFVASVFLDGSFSEGFYSVVITYAISGTSVSETTSFRVDPGGNSDGHITAMYHFRRPNANFVVQGLETGRIVKGRNPRI